MTYEVGCSFGFHSLVLSSLTLCAMTLVLFLDCLSSHCHFNTILHVFIVLTFPLLNSKNHISCFCFCLSIFLLEYKQNETMHCLYI